MPRLLGVDATRGLALLGMAAVRVVPDRTYGVAGGRSAATFAVLAGVGLALATGGQRRAAERWPGVLARAAVIGVVGLLVGIPDSGVAVILVYYALLFVLAVPLLRLRAPALAAVALAVAVAVPVASQAVRDHLPSPDRGNPTPADLVARPLRLLLELALTGYYPALAWLAYLAAGLAVGRLPLRSPRVAAGLLAGGAGVAVLSYVTADLLLALPAAQESVDQPLPTQFYGTTPTTSWWYLAVRTPHASTPLDLLHTTGCALAVLGALLLLAHAARPLLVPLAAAGSMTLTLYTAHVLALAGDVLPADPEESYLLQVLLALAVATLWRHHVGRGPLEAVAARAAQALPVAGRRSAVEHVG